MSNIEWTDVTWNPVVGCTPVSPGCLNCYAATMAKRLEGMGKKEYQPREATVDEYAARHAAGVSTLPSIDKCVRIAEVKSGRAVFTGEVRTVDERLTAPLHWKKPRRVFVNSMSDLFHEKVPFEFIDRVMAVAALTPRHTYQILTKRPERMAVYFSQFEPLRIWRLVGGLLGEKTFTRGGNVLPYNGAEESDWWDEHGPLPNVWLGTSVENQAAADERIPHLLRCKAVVRFLSVEPLLGPVDLLRVSAAGFGGRAGHKIDCIRKGFWAGEPWGFVNHTDLHDRFGKLHWVIVGGESGPGARACDVAWIRSIVQQCKEAAEHGMQCFVKQLGARVTCANDKVSDWLDECHLSLDDIETEGVMMQGDPVRVRLCDRKGGVPAEWPADLRVRQFPLAAGESSVRPRGAAL